MPVQHILVVDDSKSARLMLRKMLQGLGLTVDAVESGEEALQYLSSQRPDLVFMDHTMPGMDGLTAARTIQSDPHTAGIFVAMYTSKDEPSYREEAFAAGAIDVLTKPAVPEALSTLIDRVSAQIDAALKARVQQEKASSDQPPTTVASAVAVSAPVSADWIEKIAADRAERVFYEAIESQVLPLINDVALNLRQEIERNQAKVIEQVTTQISEAWLGLEKLVMPAEVGPSAATLLAFQAQLDDLAQWIGSHSASAQENDRPALEQWARQVATETCKNQMHALSEQLVRQISQRFSEVSHKIMANARETAEDTVLRALEAEAAQKLAAQEAHMDSDAEHVTAAKRAARQMWLDAQSDLRQRMYLAAAVAAFVSIGAAAVTYYLLQR